MDLIFYIVDRFNIDSYHHHRHPAQVESDWFLKNAATMKPAKYINANLLTSPSTPLAPMTPYFGPQEPASEVTLERYFLASDFISGIGYGAQGVLYFICTHYLWTQRKVRRMNMFMLAYITMLFLISTIVQIAQAHRTQLVFIENRNSPGGPWGYYTASLGGTANIVGQSASVALLSLSELFMVWRCWVVWYSVNQWVAYAVTFFPSLMLVASLTSAILYFYAIVHPASLVAGTHTPAWGVTYYTLMLSTNVIVTALILARLIAHRRTVRNTLASAHAGEYTSLISMLIESAAFYSIIGAGCLIATGVGSPSGSRSSARPYPPSKYQGT
ncbi:hypothetical protein BD779DRAFT_290583 [Infundibulicybe gibba]|nr:hypothetical protein BD779DRAFT_290583 [Infundibulicybe gibba]